MLSVDTRGIPGFCVLIEVAPVVKSEKQESQAEVDRKKMKFREALL